MLHSRNCPFYGQPEGVPPDDRCICPRPDYREGYGLAVEHANGNYAQTLAPGRSPDYYRGYEVASIRLTGGHSVRYADADTVDLHRETVEQLVELFESLINEPERAIPLDHLVNILPHLKRALGDEA